MKSTFFWVFARQGDKIDPRWNTSRWHWLPKKFVNRPEYTCWGWMWWNIGFDRQHLTKYKGN